MNLLDRQPDRGISPRRALTTPLSVEVRERFLRFQLRSELCGEPKLVPEPADVGPGGAGAAGVVGAVLDRAEEELEFVAKRRDPCGCPWRHSIESFKRLVEPASQVLLEIVAGQYVLLARVKRLSSLRSVEVEGSDLAFEQLSIVAEAAYDELEGVLEALLRDRVKAELGAGEDEGADPDAVREPRVRALEEERVRRQRRPAGEQLRTVAGELEALAGSVFALADPQ